MKPLAQSDQRQVNYRRGYPMRQCAVCRMYVKKKANTPFGACTKVTGSITPFGLCDLWGTLNNPYGNKLNAQSRMAMEQLYDAARGGPGR